MNRKRSFRRRQKPPFAIRAKDHCRKFTAFMFSNVGIILLVILYTIAGAFMFRAIEVNEALKGSKKLQTTFDAIDERKRLALKLWKISCCEVNTIDENEFRLRVDEELRAFQQKLVKNELRGGDITKEWSFSGAFLFSLTVITTIGYGNISPRSNIGKLMTIIYAIIGMPLFLLYLSNIGDILAKSFKWIYAKFCLCRICPGVARRRAIREKRKILRQQRQARDSNSEGSTSIQSISIISGTSEYDDDIEAYDIDVEIGFEDTETVTVPVTVSVAIMIGYILFGATLFSEWEKWNILDGSYFCFISLSSIGFGDIVPGDKVITADENTVEVSFILCAVYLLLGMALIAMCFNLMQYTPGSVFTRHIGSRKVRVKKDIAYMGKYENGSSSKKSARIIQ